MSASIHDIEVDLHSHAVKSLVRIDGKVVPVTAVTSRSAAAEGLTRITLEVLLRPGDTPVSVRGQLLLDEDLPDGVLRVDTPPSGENRERSQGR